MRKIEYGGDEYTIIGLNAYADKAKDANAKAVYIHSQEFMIYSLLVHNCNGKTFSYDGVVFKRIEDREESLGIIIDIIRRSD